ncbi:tetracycline resistance protein, class D-like isoform X2 [Microplitis mediator]|uniref:tetracycline resistance protein, class D-like isoform X2 n=1 Tax=Microplitis mediator TaxID=375433 RepID=UPI002556AFB4|nr:tetracycline resistance protein, class D-like isoform X2 [Microplitis mediator]
MDNKHLKLVKTGWRRYVFIELPIFFASLANGMISNVFIDLIVYQTCRQITTKNESTCDILHTNSSSEEARELNKIVQPHASYIIMCKLLIESILPAIFILFLGPWSDKYGRKPLLTVGYFALMCNSIIISILSYADSNPWMFLSASIPSALLGSGLLLATYCYISDTTEDDKRAWSLACLETCRTIGLVVGTLVGPLIFQKSSYSLLFIISASLYLTSLLYVLFLVPETIRNESNKWGNPFDFSLVKQLILTCIKKRDGLNRGLLWSCLFILSLFTIIINGYMNIAYLFATAKFGWNTIEFSIYSSVSMLLSIVGTFGGLKVMRDYIGCLSGFAAGIVYSLSLKPWQMYLGICFGMCAGIVLPTTQSIMSKSAPIDDLGKVFSLVTFMETILPLGSAPLYSLVYSSSISVYPSPVYILTSGIFFLMIIINIIVNVKFIRHESFHQSTVIKD